MTLRDSFFAGSEKADTEKDLEYLRKHLHPLFPLLIADIEKDASTTASIEPYFVDGKYYTEQGTARHYLFALTFKDKANGVALGTAVLRMAGNAPEFADAGAGYRDLRNEYARAELIQQAVQQAATSQQHFVATWWKAKIG